MRLLSIVRHAKSSWADAGLSDFERPLNERGRRDAPRMAEEFRERLGVPDRLVSSPALRAISTARQFADTFGIDGNGLQIEARIYEASTQTLVYLASGFDDACRHVMLFGHNPGLSELSRFLGPCPFQEMPTCAIAHFELDIARWSDLQAGCGRLQQYLYPKRLRD